jgi:hypothetical protein
VALALLLSQLEQIEQDCLVEIVADPVSPFTRFNGPDGRWTYKILRWRWLYRSHCQPERHDCTFADGTNKPKQLLRGHDGMVDRLCDRESGVCNGRCLDKILWLKELSNKQSAAPRGRTLLLPSPNQDDSARR